MVMVEFTSSGASRVLVCAGAIFFDKKVAQRNRDQLALLLLLPLLLLLLLLLQLPLGLTLLLLTWLWTPLGFVGLTVAYRDPYVAGILRGDFGGTHGAWTDGAIEAAEIAQATGLQPRSTSVISPWNSFINMHMYMNERGNMQPHCNTLLA